jgi:hypothetical protein
LDECFGAGRRNEVDRQAMTAPHVLEWARPGDRKDQCAHALRVTKDEALRDRTAHRNPEDDRPVDLEVVQQVNRVVGHLIDRGRSLPARTSGPPVVEHDEPIGRRYGRDLSGPEALVERETHDAEDGVAVTVLAVMEADVAELCERHGGKLTDGERLRSRGLDGEKNVPRSDFRPRPTHLYEVLDQLNPRGFATSRVLTHFSSRTGRLFRAQR